jgi:pimeloyl-ACP methyl ester carboxylesterase
VGGVPKTDAVAAFDYYIKNFNNGRPFILAGHSQGSIVMMLILSGYLKENPEVYKRMVAAYIIGASITPEYLAANPHLKFAQGADDTGVIISYNTEAPAVEGKSPVLVPGAMAINPITWTRDETLAEARENLGSIMVNKNGSPVLDKDGKIAPVLNYADARVDLTRGVVICSVCNVEKLAPGNVFSGQGVFHSFDYSFYYFNIRENAAHRAEIFLNR